MLTRMEELLLLAVWRLQQDAYGLAIRRHIADLLGKKVSVGAVYIPLERLARRGLLASTVATSPVSLPSRSTSGWGFTSWGAGR